jgi:hypothetical protein
MRRAALRGKRGGEVASFRPTPLPPPPPTLTTPPPPTPRFAGEKPQSAALKAGRAHMAFRYNILHHLGVVSTLRAAKSKAFPK